MATLGFRQLTRGFDLGLFTVTVVLVLFGLAALYSFSINITQPDYSLLIRQGIFVSIGIILAIVFMRLDYRFLGGIHWVLYGGGVALLAAVLLFGATIRGTTGWFEFPGFQFQPVEIVKIILTIFLAKYFSDQVNQMTPMRLIITSGLLTAVPVGLVLLQPDFGSAVILLSIWMSLLFALPIPRRLFLWVGLGFIVAAVIGWFFLLQPYQKERIMNVLSPARDPLGTGYNVRQSITAIGAGQIFGRGLGLGTQSQLNFLPERQTDFIFASIAEELGLVGSVAIVVLFGLFFWRIAVLVSHVRDDFSLLLGLGIGAMLFIQAAINILMNIGIFPVTGLPLPFLSYGGSSLLASLIAVGIIESIVVRNGTTLR